MNILILNWKDIKNPEVGGAEIIAFELARKLKSEGHTVTFFSRSFKNASPEETIDGVKVIRKGNKFSVYFHAFLYYHSLSTKPDKVVDMINTICWQTPLYVPEEKRIAYVNQLAKEVLFYELPFLLSVFSYLFERVEYLPYKRTKFIVYSDSTKQDLVSFGVEKNKISVFPLGVDHKRYVQGDKKAKDPLFVFVARLVRMKRADLCIEAMRIVLRNIPKARLAIIGNGPDEERLQKRVKEFNLEKNILFITKSNFFVDKNPSDVKVEWMQEAWALLLPSVKEGWGMVVTEAAACGTPAIVSGVTGLVDSVKAGETGLILSKNPDPSELAIAMQKIVEDKYLREQLGKGAIAWSKQFTWEKSYQTFKETLFRS